MQFDCYIPTRVLFGAGKLERLATEAMPGKKALICVTEDQLMKKLGIQDRVVELLAKNSIDSVVFDKVTPNPTRKGVMEAAGIAKAEGCDFFIGLGGGSSIDTAKAAAIMMVNEGDLWDYASAGTGGRKEVKGAFPVVTITTTAGTGTECDPWCVITNEVTREKLDFGLEAVYPVISIIDPELMLTLPYSLTCYQGFDALFHAVECYIATCGSEMSKLYSYEAIKLVCKYLPVLTERMKDKDRDVKGDLEARANISFAANVLCGYAQSLAATISPHIIGQCMGGLHGGFPHGATLIVTAEEYYKEVVKYLPKEFGEMAEAMGEDTSKYADADKGQAFVDGLVKLLDATGMRGLAMSQFGIAEDELEKIADISLGIGFDFDPYTLTRDQVVAILKRSYK